MSNIFDQDNGRPSPPGSQASEGQTSSSDALIANLKSRFGLDTTQLPPEASSTDLLIALHDPAWQKRSAAAHRLGKMHALEALQPLIDVLQTDPESSTRAVAARALGEMQTREAEQALTDALNDADANVRTAAAQALGKIGPQLSDKSIHALVESFFGEEEEYARAAVIAALGKLGDRTPLDVLEAALLDDEWPVREAAALAVGKQGAQADKEALEELLDDEALPVCKAAIFALSQLVETEVEIHAQPEGDGESADDAEQEPDGQKGISGNVEFIKLVPASVHNSLPVISQAFDNQWVPSTLLAAILKGKISYDDAQKYIDYLARADYMRSLLNSERLIINRAYIYNNPWLYRDFLPGSANREAFKGLLAEGVIVPFLYTETDPVQHLPWLTIHENGFSAWTKLCQETLVQCMRFSWDDEQNQKRAQDQLALSFHTFATVAYAKDVGKFLKDLGLNSSKQQESDFAKRLDDLQGESVKYFRSNERRHVVRGFLYEQFVSVGNPALRIYDGSKPFAGAIKQLLDLAYNSSLADALECHLITPADSPTRLVLQDWHKMKQGMPTISAADLIEMLSKDTFQIMQKVLAREGLRSMGALNLWDILALRQRDEWKVYIARLRDLLAHPLQFKDLAGEVATSYIALTDQITRRIGQRNLQGGGTLTAPWHPSVEITLTIGGLDTTFLWNYEGAYSTIGDKAWVKEMLGKIQIDPTSGSTMCNLRLTVTDWQRRAHHAQLSSRVEVLQGRLENAREQWEAVVRKLGEALKSQEFTSERERTATINQAGTPP